MPAEAVPTKFSIKRESPSASFIICDLKAESDRHEGTGLVDYCFRPESFEVRHIRAPGQVNVSLDDLFATAKAWPAVG